MARARNIKPGLFKNELLGVADPYLTLLFQSLWTLADREGRLEDRPLRIKAETFPYREGLDVNGYLTELQRLGFILRYSVAGEALIQIINFKKHQTPHNTEKPSELPAYVENTQSNQNGEILTVKPPLSDGEIPAALPPDSLIPLTLIPDSLIPSTLKPDTKTKAAAFALPDWIDPNMWDLWMKTRKGKKMIPAQMQAQVNKLQGWKDAGIDYAAALAASAEAGWSGLFEPKLQRGGVVSSQSENQQIREAARKRLFGSQENKIETI